MKETSFTNSLAKSLAIWICETKESSEFRKNYYFQDIITMDCDGKIIDTARAVELKQIVLVTWSDFV